MVLVDNYLSSLTSLFSSPSIPTPKKTFANGLEPLHTPKQHPDKPGVYYVPIRVLNINRSKRAKGQPRDGGGHFKEKPKLVPAGF